MTSIPMETIQENQPKIRRAAMGGAALAAAFAPIWLFGFLIGQQIS